MNARHATLGWLLALVTLMATAWAEEPVIVYPSTAAKVDKLWVLSPEWLLLANDYMDETDARIYAGDRPLYEALLQDQIKLEAGLNPNWVNLKKRVRFWQRDYLRFSTAHLWMRDASRFQVSSPDDPAYASPRCPVQAQNWVVSLGDRIEPAGSPLRDCWNYEIGHYAYVRLPTPLKPGCRYRIVQADGRQADLTFDPAALIVPVLKVNQVGYLSDASAKIAYLGGWIPGLGPVDYARFTRFEVRRLSDGQTVFSGVPHKRYTDTPTRGLHQNAAYSGETVYELDFSAVCAAGSYALVVPRSGTVLAVPNRADRHGIRVLHGRPGVVPSEVRLRTGGGVYRLGPRSLPSAARVSLRPDGKWPRPPSRLPMTSSRNGSRARTLWSLPPRATPPGRWTSGAAGMTPPIMTGANRIITPFGICWPPTN